MRRQSRSGKIKDDDLELGTLSEAGEKLRAKGVYYLTGEIENDSLLDIHQDILDKHLDEKWNKDIQIIINSCGGLCTETWALIDLLDWCKMDVRTVGMGECSSMGAILLACGTPGKRMAAKNCEIMIHKHMMGMYDKHDELIASMKSSDDEYRRQVHFWLEHSKYTKESEILKHILTTTDNFLTPLEAYKHGIVDQVQGVPESELNKPVKTSQKKKVYKKTKKR